MANTTAPALTATIVGVPATDAANYAARQAARAARATYKGHGATAHAYRAYFAGLNAR